MQRFRLPWKVDSVLGRSLPGWPGAEQSWLPGGEITWEPAPGHDLYNDDEVGKTDAILRVCF